MTQSIPTVAVNRTMTPSEWELLLALSVLWGGSFFFTAVAVAELPPFTVVVLRVGLAALILNIAISAVGLRMPRDRQTWRAFFGMGILNNVMPVCLIVWGQTHIASGLAAILNATTPLWTVIVAHLLTSDERMTGNRLAGVIVGFIGVVVMIGPAALAGLGANVAAQLAVSAAGMSYALAGVYGRRFEADGQRAHADRDRASDGIDRRTVAGRADRRPSVDAADAEPIGVGRGARHCVALHRAGLCALFSHPGDGRATNLLLVTFLFPVSAILLGSLVLGERLGPSHFLGMSFGGAGLAAIDGRLAKLARKIG